MINPKININHEAIRVAGQNKIDTKIDIEVSIFEHLQTLVIIKENESNKGASVVNNLEAVVAAVKKAYLISVPKDKLFIVAFTDHNEPVLIHNETVTTGIEYITEEQLNKLKTGEFRI